MAAITAPWSATSATTAKFASPAATASSSVARLRPSTVTVAPARARVDAIARPMPRPPPVTTAWEERGSPDKRSSPEIYSVTCVYFSPQAFARNAGCWSFSRCCVNQDTHGSRQSLQTSNYCFSYLEGLLALFGPTYQEVRRGRISADENQGWPLQL